MPESDIYAILYARWVGGFGDTIPLTRSPIRVGRSHKNDIVVEHEAISGHHLEILCQPHAIYVRDLGSRNGTSLDGRRLPADKVVSVPLGATVCLHNCLEFRFAAPGPDMPVMVMPRLVRFTRRPHAGLIILQRSGETQRVALTARRMTLGRGSDNDIVVGHPLISSRHAEILAQGTGSYEITDLGSRNGLIYRGERIPSLTLRPGERVYIAGQVMIQFEPVLGFVTEVVPAERTYPEATALEIHKHSVCPRCGAWNAGPQTACLRCKTPLP